MLFARVFGKRTKADPLNTPHLPDNLPPETVVVEDTHVCCDGPEFSRHPRVWLEMGEDNRVYCPYCSRLFVLKDE